MAFLDFLKKKKKPEFGDELDLPPAPPSLADIEKELPPFEPEIPAFEPVKEPEVKQPIIPEPRIGPLPEIKLPEKEEVKRVKPLFRPRVVEEFEERAVEEEKEILEHKTITQPLFVRMDSYKGIIRELNYAKADLKKAEDGINLLLDVKSNKEKEFDKWRKILEDIQKKLIFVDKILFKG